MEQYHFVTDWFLAAPLEQVWGEIVDSRTWPLWLTDFRSVTTHPTDGSTPAAFDITYRGDLPYTFRFTLTVVKQQPPYLLELTASGDLVGTGQWRLAEQAGGTAVTYTWDVGTANPWFSWMVRLPLVKGLTEHNHNATMDRAYRALQTRLGLTTTSDP